MVSGRIDDVTLKAVARGRAQAEFNEMAAILRLHEQGCAAVDATGTHALDKELGRREVTLSISQSLRLTENAIWSLVGSAQTLRDVAPKSWAAFRAGDINEYRATLIADTAEALTTAPGRELLDANAVDFAVSHTPAELKSWLRRFKAKVEPERATELATAAVQTRRVSVTHNDDGTSWLNALMPTHVAVAVAGRLRKAARLLPALDPDTGERDLRTRDQKQADLVAHWLTCSEGTHTDVRAEIAISIDATDLIGLTGRPGTIRGDGDPVPAEWVRELAQSETTLFRRLVLDPIGQVLDSTKLGYQPSESLRRALHWRDGTCRVAGCAAPVAEVDLDHEVPWEHSHDTSGRNLRCLCRKHHNLKSHGHLPSEFLDDPVQYRERWYPVDTRVYEFDFRLTQPTPCRSMTKTKVRPDSR